MKEGSQLTRQSALAHSGDVPRGILNEGTAEVPKVAAGDEEEGRQPVVDPSRLGSDQEMVLVRAISDHLDLIEASISGSNMGNEPEMAGNGAIRSASIQSALATVQSMLKELSDDFSCKAKLTHRFNAAERNYQARCPPSLNFQRTKSEICPYEEPSGSSVTLARRTTIDALTPNDEENKYLFMNGDCSIDRSDKTCCESQSSMTSDIVSELDESLVKVPSQIDVVEDNNGSTAFTSMYNWGSGSFGSLWHHKSEPVEILRSECSLVSFKNRRSLTCVSINENHSAAEVLAVGMNDSGEVDPQREESEDNMIRRPAVVEALVTHFVVSVSCGLRHTACLTSSGTVMTYGSNENFACGHPPSPFDPCRVSAGAMNLGRHCGAAVACGDRFTMVLTTHIEVLICGIGECAGDAKRTDQNDDVCQPSLLPSLTGLPITLIVAGSSHALVVTSLGYAYAWGFNPGGCCGLSALPVVGQPTRLRVDSGPPAWLKEPPGSTFTSSDPTVDISLAETLVSDNVAVISAAAGRQHTVLITRSGRVLCCGRNKSGQCGFDPAQPGEQNICPPMEPSITKYLDVVGLLPTSKPCFVHAACGDTHTLLLDDTGDVWHMGTQDVLPKSSWTPARKVSLSSGPLNAFFVAAGGRQSVALSSGTRTSGGCGDTGGSAAAAAAAVDSKVTTSLTPIMMVKRNRPIFLSPEIDLLKHLEEFEQNKGGQQDGNGKLIRAVGELFKRPSILMNAFFEPESLERLYKRLLSAEKVIGIVEILTEDIRKGLARFPSEHLFTEEAVRCFLLYWQCPINVHPAQHGYNVSEDLFLSLCNQIMLLPYPRYRALMGWIKAIYPHHLFVARLIYPLQQHISHNIRMMGLSGRSLHVLCSLLYSLHSIHSRGVTLSGQELNHSTLDPLHDDAHAGRIVPTELFYNSTVNELPPNVLVENFITWRQSSPKERARAFYLCSFPFLITPLNKMLLMRSEVEYMRLKSGLGSFVFVLEVDREHILQQTIAQVASATDLAYKIRLKVKFMGEEGVDEGGPRQEFLLLLTSCLFDINLGMWDEVGDNQLWFNKDCSWNDDAYTLVGIILGLAIYNGALVDVSFPQVMYRKLLGLPLGFEDLYDEDVRNGLRKLLDYDDNNSDMEEVFSLNFEVNWQSFGEMVSVELKPGGKDIPVTSENVVEYVKLFVKWALVDSVRRQFDLFKAGFDRVMRDTSISLLQPEELEDIVVGTKELNIGALKSVTKYEGGYDANTPVVRFFWRFMNEADLITHQKVLKFVTGSKSAPIGGLEKVPFRIQRAGPDSSSLPTASTCFSVLLLPEYSTYEKLCNRLSIAVNQCVGFGLY